MNRYIISFFIFSFLGWVWESIYCTIKERKWANRGFLYGPICPIYGSSAVLGLFAYDLIKAGLVMNLTWWKIFIIGFIVSMILEYPTSWVLEKLFHARWWDYSDLPLNLNGRTSVPTSAAFGVAAILIMKIIIPCADKILLSLPEIFMEILPLILIALISVDATLTITALTNFQKQVSALDENFQKKMTEVVDHIYSTQSAMFQKAVSRIVSFKLPVRKHDIANLLREKKLKELFENYFDQDKK